MRLLGIFLLLCVSVGTVSSFSFSGFKLPSWLPSWLKPWLPNPIDVLKNDTCSYLAQHPDRATTAFTTLNETLQSTAETRQTFVLTINYINSPTNLQNLVSGTSACLTALSDLYNALMTDVQNQNFNSATAKQKVLDILTNWLNSLKNSSG